MTVFVREYWTLFELVWQVRSDILHSKDSIGAKTRNEHLAEQLLHFKYNADTMLQCGDKNQIDYPRAKILSWTRARKNGLLHLLKIWHKQYLAETMIENRGQRPLTTFGFTARHTARDRHNLDDPSTGDGVT